MKQQKPITRKVLIPFPLPPSPTAASLGIFGEVGVGFYTGAVNYSIPVYTFQTRHLELPISLDYSSTGLKVDQIASWVGIGWSLNAGGVINRTVRDWPDELATESIPDLTQIGQQSVIDYILDSDLATHDSESDVYSFNFGRFSANPKMKLEFCVAIMQHKGCTIPMLFWSWFFILWFNQLMRFFDNSILEFQYLFATDMLDLTYITLLFGILL